MSPEERLAQSAPRRWRAHPWDEGVRQESLPVRAKREGWWERLRTSWSAWQSRRNPGAPPSLPALLAALAYYDGRYQNMLPDPTGFQDLVKRWGSPDWPNPYPDNVLPYFRLHPMGFLAADLEMVIDGWWRRMSQQEQGATPAPPVLEWRDKPGYWPTVDETEQQLHHHEEHDRARAHTLARVCWAMLMHHGTGLPHLTQQVHADNLSLAVGEAMNEPTLAQWGLSSELVRVGALRQGLRLPEDQPSLL